MSATLTNTHPLDAIESSPEVIEVTQRRVIHAEWIKLRSVRSTRLTLLLATVAVVAFGLLVSALTDGKGPEGVLDPVAGSLGGANIAQLVLGVLGALLMTSEYSTGLIRSTFAAVPSRLPVLWAKATVYGGVTFVLMLVAIFAAFLGGQAIYGGIGVGASLSDDGALRAVLGAVVYPVLIGVMGVALGALLRHTATTIAVLFGGLFIAPGLANALGSWADGLTSFLPSQAGEAASSVVSDPDLLSPLGGLLVLIAWAVGLLALAAVFLRRRDV